MILDLERFFNMKNSLTRFFLFLLGFALLATFDAYPSEPIVLAQLIVIGLATLACVYVLRTVRGVTTLNPLNFFITGLIIHVLMHPTANLVFPALAVIVVALMKHFGGKRQPIFNPAALALLITYYFSVVLNKMGLTKDTLLISWWGADMNQAFLSELPFAQILVSAGLLIGFIYFMMQYRKNILTGMFFMAVMGCVFYANLSEVRASGATIDFLMASLFNSFAFMALVMIPEPKTSPSFIKQQALVGIFGGFVFYVLTFVFPRTENGFILTILSMNLVTVALKQGKLLQK